MRFIEQEQKVPVYNVDTPNTVQFRHGSLFPNTVRSLILGSLGYGKTKFVYTMLVSENGLQFENVNNYLKTLDQPKYKLLKRIIDGIDGVYILTFFENDAVISPEKVLLNSVFVMDDVIGESQNDIQRKLDMKLWCYTRYPAKEMGRKIGSKTKRGEHSNVEVTSKDTKEVKSNAADEIELIDLEEIHSEEDCGMDDEPSTSKKRRKNIHEP